MFKNPLYVYGNDDICVPVKLNFGDFILKKLLKYDNKTAVVNTSTNKSQTYREIAETAVNVAVSLVRIGVRKGDVVAVCSENREEYFSTLIGIACTGAVFSPVNTGYTQGELKHVLNISQPKYVFCSPDAYKSYRKTLKDMKFVEKIMLFGSEAVEVDGAVSWRDLTRHGRAGAGGQFEAAPVAGQRDALCVLYSSGTTGLPKGVVLTHLNVITLCCTYKPILYKEEDGEEAASLTFTPWYHAMGLMGLFAYLSSGKKLTYMPKFEINSYLENIEKFKIKQLTVVPPVLVALSKTDIKNDLSSVKLIYSGAAPLYKDTLEEVHRKFPNLERVVQGYGMTEATLAVTRDTADLPSKPGGVGYVMPSSVVKVVDVETRKPLGPNQPGEICAYGPMIMKGYIGKDRKEDFDHEAFYRTGDIGYYDEDKYFFIVDRLKELIKYKGFQVPPAEIEALLLQHEAVRDVGVIGVEDKLAGEVPLAFVVTKPGATVTEEELKKFVAQRLSNPKHLRGGVRFIQAIPKNASGKILRRELRKMAKNISSKL